MAKNKESNQTAHGSVKVRMYRHGLGDCFLLQFPTTAGKVFNMLIDCGIVLGAEKASEKMGEVVEDIQTKVGSHLDLLVITHEHWDHVSGFIQAQELFEEITIKNIWFAWTEDPSNALAKRLRHERSERHRSLRAALWKLPQALLGEYSSGVASILDLFGDWSLAANGKNTTEGALTYLKRKEGAAIRYCRPGETLSLDGVEGVRIYVMGPPEDETLLMKDLPSKKDAETYGLAQWSSATSSFLSAATRDPLASPEESERDVHQPFDRVYGIPMSDATSSTFLSSSYGTKDSANAWRRIDFDWLMVAGELALNLDSDTNNTSLVLAIELLESEKVMLFPGDAQVGNWLSWEKLEWKVKNQNGEEIKENSARLLAKTVLYKVGHHGSHNATLRAKGLELMTNSKLVAMIPVDHKTAVKKNWTKMPFLPLLEKLSERTHGRMVRIDDKTLEVPAGSDLNQSEVKQYMESMAEKKLFYEYSIPM